MNDIKLELNVAEVNTVIKALSQFPYNQVHELIAKIHQEASAQLSTEQEKLMNENKEEVEKEAEIS